MYLLCMISMKILTYISPLLSFVPTSFLTDVQFISHQSETHIVFSINEFLIVLITPRYPYFSHDSSLSDKNLIIPKYSKE